MDATASPGSRSGVGAVSLVLFPILMARRPHPLVPLSLFRNREFATINLATFLIYGALYVSFTYTALLYQGTLGYSATGAAIIGLPAGILLATLSARIGGLTARFGSRIFLVAGPLIVAAGPALARPDPGVVAAVAGRARPAGDSRPADRCPDRRPAGGRRVRARDGDGRGAADEHADGLDPGAQLGSRVGDQQRPVAGRPAAPRAP